MVCLTKDYFKMYFTDSPLAIAIAECFLVTFYFLPLVWLADCVGIPSKVADGYVYRHSKRIHYLKSSLDTSVFNPNPRRPSSSSNKKSEGPKIIETNHAVTDDLIKNIRDFTGDKKVMVYVGRLAPEKNVEFLIQSLADPALSDFSLLIVGDGPTRDQLHILASSIVGPENVFSINQFKNSKLVSSIYRSKSIEANSWPIIVKDNEKVSKRVVFTGMIRDEYQVASFYAQSDVFVSASESETFGFTVAEAMACGIPAVVVNGGAFPVVFHEIKSWMFASQRFDEFVKNVLQVTNDTSGNSCKKALDVAERSFGVSVCLDDFLQTYSDIIEGKY
jgi:glycosyltransferase involved in cell wall biosynthesis